MTTRFVRATLVALVALAAACGGDEDGSARTKALKAGMTAAQAIAAMGDGPLTATGADTVRVVSGYRRMRYLVAGKQFEVLYARDLPGDVKEPLLQKQETPLVFANDTLLGWGWRYYVDEAIAKLGLPTPLRAVDTMTTPKDTAPPAPANPPAAPQAPVDTTKKA